MKTYKAVLFARLRGAIGICYQIETTVEGESPEDAHMRLYERFEHISYWKLTEITEGNK